MSKKSIQLPTQEDFQRYVEIATYVLPFPIWVFSLVSAFSEKCPFTSRLTYFLMAICHLLKLYNELSSPIYSSDPAYLRIWLSAELHILILVFAVSVSDFSPFLFFLDVLLLEGENAIIVIKEQLSGRLGEIRDSVIDMCDSIINAQFLKIVRAVIEILMVPYFFFHALFTFRSEELAGFVFYTVGYAAFQLLASKSHIQVWSFVGNFLNDLAEKNKETFGQYITQFVDAVKVVPTYVKMIYPIKAGTKTE